jgi:hypothetical protein
MIERIPSSVLLIDMFSLGPLYCLLEENIRESCAKSYQSLADNQSDLKSNLIAMYPVLLWEKPLLLIASYLTTVEHIVLDYEDGVKHEAAVAKRKLYRVACDATPVMLEVAVDTKLRQAQDTSNHVEEDLPDAPAARALVTVVCEDLGCEFDQRHQELDVAKGIHNVQLDPVGRRVVRRSRPDNNADDEDAHRGTADDTGDEAAGARAGVALKAPERAEEILRGGDDTKDEGVQRKDDIVEGDGWGQAAVAGGILAAHDGRPVEEGIGNKIRSET